MGFSFYVSNFGTHRATYGALAAVIALLFYFYISAAVLLFGAEVNAEIYREVAESEDEDGGGGTIRRAEDIGKEIAVAERQSEPAIRTVRSPTSTPIGAARNPWRTASSPTS